MVLEGIQFNLTEVMIAMIGLGVVVALIVSLFVKDDGVVIIAITLGILMVVFLILEILLDPVAEWLYQFLFLVGVFGIAIGAGLITKIAVMKLSSQGEAE